jgi:hypothetical protein
LSVQAVLNPYFAIVRKPNEFLVSNSQFEKIGTISRAWRRIFFLVSGKFPRQIMKKEKGRVKNVAAAGPN